MSFDDIWNNEHFELWPIISLMSLNPGHFFVFLKKIAWFYFYEIGKYFGFHVLVGNFEY